MRFLIQIFFSFIIFPILFEILFLLYDTCRESDNILSIITPKKFVKVTRFKELSHNGMLTLFYFSQALCKITKCDLSMFNVNLLEANQIDNLSNSIFNISDK